MGKDVNSVINTCFFFCFFFCPTAACQGFFRTKWSTTQSKHQMRLLLQNPGGTFLQIQTDRQTFTCTG